MEKYLQETKMLDFSNNDIQQLIADKGWILQTDFETRLNLAII